MSSSLWRHDSQEGFAQRDTTGHRVELDRAPELLEVLWLP